MGSETSTTNTKVSVYTGNADKISKQIESYRKLIEDKNKALKEAREKQAENSGLIVRKEAEYKAQQEYADGKISDLDEKISLDSAMKAYNDANDEISAVIEQTKVMPDLVVDFLKLTNKIIPTVNKQNGDTQKLITGIEQVHEFLDRDCNVDARIREVFVGRYDRIGIVIKNELDIDYAKDIVGDEAFIDESLIPLVKQAIQDAATEYEILIQEHKDTEEDDPEFQKKKEKLEELKPTVKWIDAFDGRQIKQVGYSPRKWESDQVDKLKKSIEELDTFCPIMAKFFDAAYEAIQLSLVILDINDSLNEQQRKALESAPKNEETVQDDKKEIEAPKDDDGSAEMFDYSGIQSIGKNEELSAAIETNTKLISVVVEDLDIIDSDEFKQIFDKPENGSAKVFAREVQITCLQMMKCQGAARGQILLAQKILRLKPANVDSETNKFWAALDQGLTQIFFAVSEINAASNKFFSFFSRLQDSFIKYTNLGQDISYLKKDLSDFLQFRNDYGEKLELLSKQALKTITGCIEQNIGDENVERALKQVDDLRGEYEDALRKYNAAKSAQRQEYLIETQKAAKIKGEWEQAIQLKAFYKKFADDIEKTDKGEIEKKIKDLEAELEKSENYEIKDVTITKD